MEYIIKAIKHNQKNKSQIGSTPKWHYAVSKVRNALESGKYSKVIIERSNVVKVFYAKKKEV